MEDSGRGGHGDGDSGRGGHGEGDTGRGGHGEGRTWGGEDTGEVWGRAPGSLVVKVQVDLEVPDFSPL